MPRLRQYWRTSDRDGVRDATTVYADEFIIHDDCAGAALACEVGGSGSMIGAMHGSTLTTTTTTTL